MLKNYHLVRKYQLQTISYKVLRLSQLSKLLTDLIFSFFIASFFDLNYNSKKIIYQGVADSGIAKALADAIIEDKKDPELTDKIVTIDKLFEYIPGLFQHLLPFVMLDLFQHLIFFSYNFLNE
jgi:hypothetical protein